MVVRAQLRALVAVQMRVQVVQVARAARMAVAVTAPSIASCGSAELLPSK